LAVAAAVTSSLRDRALDHATVLFGEVGLTGEVRSVPRMEHRLMEAKKMGFSRAIVPESGLSRLRSAELSALQLVGVRDLGSALRAAFDKS